MTDQNQGQDGAQVHGWTADDSTFGARLALVRQRMGWGNVREAAKACGLPVETWRSWERDGREPRQLSEVCMAISRATGADLTWLAFGRVSVPDAIPLPPRRGALAKSQARRRMNATGEYRTAVRRNRALLSRSPRSGRFRCDSRAA